MLRCARVFRGAHNLNFLHKSKKFNLEQFNATFLENIDFLWMSPPCQPYTTKGKKRDLLDNRTKSFLKILESIEINPPFFIGFENVVGFKNSNARELLLNTLKKLKYNINEVLLCPSELGIPNRRPRYYLVASKEKLCKIKKVNYSKELKDFLIEPQKPHLIPEEKLNRFSNGFRILKIDEKDSYTTCFTSSYGKSYMYSGSYIECKDGVRFFEPIEIANLLGFGENFKFPKELTRRNSYKLVGNSLSIFALKVILKQII